MCGAAFEPLLRRRWTGRNLAVWRKCGNFVSMKRSVLHLSAWLAVWAALAGALSTACTPAPATRQAQGAAWGTTYHITYTAPRDLTDSIVAQIALVDSTLSMFNAASEVSRVNASAQPVRVSGHFARVFEISARVNELSAGSFDPTVAPIVELWGFGVERADSVAPTACAIDSALAAVGIAQCAIAADGTLTKKSPATRFDFSAVAKGYGVDLIAQMLRRNGCRDFMVEIGGEIAVSGVNPRGERWRIQLDSPASGAAGHEALTTVSVTDCGIATSGNYRQSRATPDGAVGHTLSPVTGRPVATRTLSATVVAPTAALADALATACMAMPLDSALIMIDHIDGVEALIVEAPDRVVVTAGFPSD